MCQMSMKLSKMFYQNPPHTLEKNSGKTHSNEKQSQTSTLTPKWQGHSKN